MREMTREIKRIGLPGTSSEGFSKSPFILS
jgi:hypothetical protein